MAIVALGTCAVVTPAQASAASGTLFGHAVRVDGSGKIVSWSGESSPYAHVARLAWRALETKFPIQDNGLETWLTYSRFDPDTFGGIAWPHNPAGLYAMLTDSATLWYEFSGDAEAVQVARKALTYELDHGTTPDDWAWARVPFASAGAGDLEYGGADDDWCNLCGRGDGVGVIEPDKVGELGFAYLRMFEMTGEARFREAAISCADALTAHVRTGDAAASPWPFRVRAQTNVVREEYSSNVVGALTLLDELVRLGLGDVQGYRRARALALHWLLSVPIVNDAWSGYFEDVDIHPDPAQNTNQYCALHTARWLLQHREVDPQWRAHVGHLLTWTEGTFGHDTPTEQGRQWGATVMSEQHDDTAKMASHTARFGATMALWFEATGDRRAGERAARSLNWATYACNEDGIVSVAENPNEGYWFTDGYADYIRHFLVALGAVPDWAPSDENHILRSTSVVRDVDYGPDRVAWETFDPRAEETLRLTFRPTNVLFAGTPARRRDAGPLDSDGYTEKPLASGGFLVHVRHENATRVSLSGAPTDDGAARDDGPTPPRPGEIGRPRAAAPLGLGVLLALVAARTRPWRRRRNSGSSGAG